MNLPMHKLGKLDRMETASVDELRHEQLQRLRWSVWHAYTNVPHYRNAFDAIGLKPMASKAWKTSPKFRLPVKTTCGTTTLLTCSQYP